MPEGNEGDPKEVALLLQPFLQDESRTIEDLINETISKTGENIRVKTLRPLRARPVESPGDGRQPPI